MDIETEGGLERNGIDMKKRTIGESTNNKTRKNTRTANNTGSIRQRPNGLWEARVVTGIDPITGKQIRKSVYGSKEKEVRRKITEIQNALDSGTYQEPSKMTVKEWLDEWLTTFCMNKLKPYTISSYRMIIDTHIGPAIGSMKLQAVRGLHVQKMYNALVANGAAPKYVKNIGAVAHKAFNVAIRQGLISVNPCDAAELPAMVQKEIKPLTDAEIPIFLKAIQGHPFENAFALCLFAGLRQGECLGLSWKQVDFDRQTITVNQQLQRERKKGGKYFIAAYTKSNKPRTIKPPAITFEYLANEKRRQTTMRLMAGMEWHNDNDLVFTNAHGGNLAIFTFYNSLKKVFTGIGRPDARPHDLRHTAATVAIASGADIKSVQSLLGHATASFTLNVYAHTSEKMMEDTAARVQNYYDQLKSML